MFDNEKLNAQFGTQLMLCRLNLMHLTDTFDNNKAIVQDLKVSNEAAVVESNDSIEITTLVTLWKDMKLDEVCFLKKLDLERLRAHLSNFLKVIEDTQGKPLKTRLGKSKLPGIVEESIVNLKQGSRKLIVAPVSKFQPFYANIPLNSILFYDITIQKVRKRF